MTPGCLQLADGRESFEVQALSGQQRISLEVRNHALQEILKPTRLPLQRAVAAIRSNVSASEVVLNRIEDLGPIAVLTDGEAGPHLPSRHELCPRRDRDGEAAFSVDITGDVGREELATVPRAGV